MTNKMNECKHEWMVDWIERGLEGNMKQVTYCLSCEKTK